jgi:MoaA/NifB/PqqE/SkfB family radical SAM enzyme
MEYPLKDLRYEVTRWCNMSCPHCFANSEFKTWQGKLLDQNVLSQIIKDALEMELEKFSFTGGEPLSELYRISHAMQCLSGKGIRTRIFTNGSLLDNRAMQVLKIAGVDEIIVSIDGLRKTHDEFRGMKGSFDKALHVLEEMKKYKFTRVARVTVHSGNYDEMPELMEKYILPLNLEKHNFRSFNPTGRGLKNMKYMLAPNQHKIAYSYLSGLQKSGVPISFLSNCFAFMYGSESDKPCKCGISQAQLDPFGVLRVCGYGSSIIGDCTKQSIKELWGSNNPMLYTMRHPSAKGICQKCKYYGYECIGGCKTSAQSTGTVNDTTCPIVQTAGLAGAK